MSPLKVESSTITRESFTAFSLSIFSVVWGGLKEDVDYVIGQAYAIRAYSYFMLAQSYARNYNFQDDPCVPIYNEPTMTTTTGQPRASVKEVYAQIDSDINKAIELLANSPAQRHPSHMGYAVALRTGLGHSG